MNTHSDKSLLKKNRSIAQSMSQLQAEEHAFAVEDNRPEMIAQRKLQEVIKSSPQAFQLKSYEDMIAQSPQNKGAAHWQTMASRYTNKQHALNKENKTGLPDHLKTGIERLSGYAMDDVRVHYNSSKPAQLQAHAFAQGTNIHIGHGQEKHLPHEAWHVVQQKKGLVKPTIQLKGMRINDSESLEREADIMGHRANSFSDQSTAKSNAARQSLASINSSDTLIQRKISYNSGRFKSREALKRALNAIFDEEVHETIEDYIKKYEESQSRAIFGSTVYDYIIDYLEKADIFPTYAKTSFEPDSTHGPMLPDQVDRHAEADEEAALKTFNFSSVTLGRLTVIDEEGKTLSFQDRQIDANFHAEDGLMDQLDQYITKYEINTEGIKINLTINNFFCAKETTNKSKASENCLNEIIALHGRYKFERFHVYFQNTYGPPELMDDSIKKIQAAGILVTSFTSTDKAPYHNELLDPASESDVDEDTFPDGKILPGLDGSGGIELRQSLDDPMEVSEGDIIIVGGEKVRIHYISQVKIDETMVYTMDFVPAD